MRLATRRSSLPAHAPGFLDLSLQDIDVDPNIRSHSIPLAPLDTVSGSSDIDNPALRTHLLSLSGISGDIPERSPRRTPPSRPAAQSGSRGSQWTSSIVNPTCHARRSGSKWATPLATNLRHSFDTEPHAVTEEPKNIVGLVSYKIKPAALRAASGRRGTDLRQPHRSVERHRISDWATRWGPNRIATG